MMSSLVATAGCGSASALTAPCPRAHAIVAFSVSSHYLTNPQLVPSPWSPISRPLPAVTTAFTPGTAAYRSHVITSSSKFPWFAAMERRL